MKKFLVFASALAASLLVSICAFKSGSIITADAEYLEDDYYYALDFNGDGDTDASLSYKADPDTKQAAIIGIYSYDSSQTVIIPSELEDCYLYTIDDEGYWQDLGTFDLTVTSIELTPEYYGTSYYSVEIPYTVEYIAPQSLGYYYDYDDLPQKQEDITLFCTKGTAGELYAQENGFEYTAYENLSLADIKLSDSCFTYSGEAITPDAIITLDGTTLTKNTDYTVVYSSNINAGDATVTVLGNGNYRGKLTCQFKINPKSASSAKVGAIAKQNYTGKTISPAVSVTLGSTKLSKNKDYTVKYSSNKNPGTAKITITFKGNYTGSKTVSFKIGLAPMKNVKAATVSNSGIKLSWSKVPCDKYYIYKYDTKTKTYKLIKTTTSTSYTISGLSQATQYIYRVKAGKTVNGKTYFNGSVKASAYTNPSAPTKYSIAVKNKAIKVSWSKNTKASGYQIYRSSDFGWTYKRVKTITSNKTVSWTNTGLSNDKYYVYAIRSYKKIGNKTYYSDFKYAFSGDAISRLNAATLKSHRSFKVCNRQGATTTSYTYTLSDKDIKILKNFAAKHFKSNMTRDEKLWVTLDWINKNVKYARGADWNQIVSKSWVDAIFTYKKGQCAQYNGAMAAMMVYLGYDVDLVQGYRGSWQGSHWQHFWCELKIDGLIYVMETGNYGENGNWMYFVARYKETSGYVRNRVDM